MSYRIHTTDADSIHVQHGTFAKIDDEMGLDDFDPDDTADHLVLNDMGNMEAMVLTGSADDFRNLARRILDQFPADDKWADDITQFPRLLAEINATQDDLDFDALSESMGLELARIDELFERAHAAWEATKKS